MPRSCQADGSIEAFAAQQLKQGAEPEVGLLLGRLSVGSKDVVLLTCRTPDQEGEPAFTATAPSAGASTAKKGGAKPRGSGAGVSAELDVDWVCEHALQVSRMLPGGVSVVGLYLWGPEGAAASAARSLLQALESLSDLPGATPGAPQLLMLMDSVTGKVAAREVPAGAKAASNFRPADLVFLPDLVANFVAVRSSFVLDAQQLVPAGQNPGIKLLRAALRREADRITGSVGILQGAGADSATLVMSVLDSAGGGDGSGVGGLEVQLFSPPAAADAVGGTSSSGSNGVASAGEKLGSVRGRVVLSGRIGALALVHKREPVPAAVELLKADLRATLVGREDVLLEEAEAAAGAAPEGSSKAGTAQLLGDGTRSRQIALPRRVLITARAPLLLGDLLLGAEGAAQAAEHARELLGITVDAATQVEELEANVVASLPATWDPSAAPARTSVASRRRVGLGKSQSSELRQLVGYVKLTMMTLVALMFLVAWLHSRGSVFDGIDDEDEVQPTDPLEMQETWE